MKNWMFGFGFIWGLASARGRSALACCGRPGRAKSGSSRTRPPRSDRRARGGRAGRGLNGRPGRRGGRLAPPSPGNRPDATHQSLPSKRIVPGVLGRTGAARRASRAPGTWRRRHGPPGARRCANGSFEFCAEVQPLAQDSANQAFLGKDLQENTGTAPPAFPGGRASGPSLLCTHLQDR